MTGRPYDRREQVEREFPVTSWQHISVRGPDEGRLVVAQLASQSTEPVFAEARWFGPHDGVILIRLPAVAEPEPPKKRRPWWQFWRRR
jgi:hypothetical protein